MGETSSTHVHLTLQEFEMLTHADLFAHNTGLSSVRGITWSLYVVLQSAENST